MEFVNVVYRNPKTLKYARIEVTGTNYSVEMWQVGFSSTQYSNCETKREAKEVVKNFLEND